MKPKSKATDANANLLTNSLALFGLYAIWKALSSPSRFDMPAGAGYKAAMELKGQGWDASAGEISYQHAKQEYDDVSQKLDVCRARLDALHNRCETDEQRAEYEKLNRLDAKLTVQYNKARAKLVQRSAFRGV